MNNVQNVSKQPPAGYRELAVGETILESDLYLNHEGEYAIRGEDKYGKHFIGESYNASRGLSGLPFKHQPTYRKLEPSGFEVEKNPGKGFRFVEPGEALQVGDWVLFGPHAAAVMLAPCLPLPPSRAGQRVSRRSEGPYPYGYYVRPIGADTPPQAAAPKPAKVERPYTVPPGYRELNDGEIVFASDYMLAKGTWVPRANTRRVGRAYGKGKAFVTIRSTVDSSKVPAGFRLLGPSEKTLDGDRYLVGGLFGCDDRTQRVSSYLGKTWVEITADGDHPDNWLGVIRPVPAPGPSFSSMLKPFQGPVVRGHIERIDGCRSVIVDRNASGAVRITINGLLGTRVISGSKEMADALLTCLSETSGTKV